MVTLSEDRTEVAAVTFEAHGDKYTRMGGLDGFGAKGGISAGNGGSLP